MSTAAPSPTHVSKSEYHVAPSLGRCHISGRTIEPGETFVTVLRETAEGLERIDVTLDHWSEFNHDGVLAFWQTTMRRPEQKKKQFVDDSVLCDLFERLASVSEPNKIGFRFVLGLILMRKRLLIYEKTRQEEGKAIWSVRMKGKTEMMDLLDPRLDEQQMLDVTGQLGQILNEEL